MSSTVTDNITEVLVKIMEFTKGRQKVLSRNINDIHQQGFVPMDLDVEGFSQLLNVAINEHVRSNRLLFVDNENIKFGPDGSFEIKATVDHYAKELLEKSRDEYLELQTNKLMENSLNKKTATELLRQKQSMISVSG